MLGQGVGPSGFEILLCPLPQVHRVLSPGSSQLMVCHPVCP